MVPIPNSNVAFGQAKEMSRNDKARLNTLYKCCKFIRELYNSTATQCWGVWEVWTPCYIRQKDADKDC